MTTNAPTLRARRQNDQCMLWLSNAPANLRASQIQCERSELPKIARLVQRTLACGRNQAYAAFPLRIALRIQTAGGNDGEDRGEHDGQHDHEQDP